MFTVFFVVGITYAVLTREQAVLAETDSLAELSHLLVKYVIT
jgi:hypothetical protein